MHGASVGNGNSFANGPAWFGWRGGFQGPRPVTCWDFMEGRDPE